MVQAAGLFVAARWGKERGKAMMADNPGAWDFLQECDNAANHTNLFDVGRQGTPYWDSEIYCKGRVERE